MLEYALRELTRRKRRTTATIAGYAVAVAVISLVIIILLNGEAAANAVLSGTGTHFSAYLPSCMEEACQYILVDREHEGFYVGSLQVRLMDTALLDLILEEGKAIEDAVPFVIFRYYNEGHPVRDFTIGGMPPGNSIALRTNSCSARDLVSGEFLTDKDAGAVLLEEGFAKIRNLHTNDTLTIGGRDFRVMGIVNSGIRIAKADVYMPMGEAVDIINTRLKSPMTGQASMFLFESVDVNSHALAVAIVEKLIGAAAATSTYACWRPATEVIGINRGSAFLITLIVFICLLAFSLQAQYASVVERRHDLGILAAIGWPKSLIIRQMLLESLVQAVVGWIAGSALALALFFLLPSGAVVGTQAAAQKQIFPVVFLFCLALAAGGGAIAGILPGLSAASKKPAECLRKL